MKRFFSFLGNEIFLGTMIALLSVFTAITSYQGAMADSDQNKFEILGMQNLNDGNAEYLTSNQEITQDYSYYDTWYINQETNPDIADYFKAEFSDELVAAIDRSGSENPFDDEYYKAKYQIPSDLFDESDANFSLASQWDERGDQLQLVMLIMALGLALTAWGSLVKEDNPMRLIFSLLGLITLVTGIIIYITMVPTVVG
jgi:hypothetical protein